MTRIEHLLMKLIDAAAGVVLTASWVHRYGPNEPGMGDIPNAENLKYSVQEVDTLAGMLREEGVLPDDGLADIAAGQREEVEADIIYVNEIKEAS